MSGNNSAVLWHGSDPVSDVVCRLRGCKFYIHKWSQQIYRVYWTLRPVFVKVVLSWPQNDK